MNPSGENTERYVLQLTADQAAAAQTKNTIKGLQADLAGVDAATQRLNQSAAAADRTLSYAFVDAQGNAFTLAQNVGAADAAVDQLAASKAGVDALAASFDNAAASAAKVKPGGGFDLNKAQSIAGAAGGVASLVGGGAAASAVSSTIALTAQLGVFGLAVGAGAAALSLATAAEKERTDAAKAFIDLVAGTAGQTSQQLHEQIDAEKARQETLTESKTVLDDFRERVQAQNDAYNYGISSQEEYQNNIRNIASELKDFTGGTVTLSDDLNSMGSNVDALDAAVSTAQKDIDTSSGKIAFLGVQLGTQATAANDAAAATQKLTDNQLDAAQRTLQIDNMTADQRAEEIASKQRQIAINDDLIRNTDLTTDAAEQLSVQSGELAVDIRKLEGVTYTYADALKAEDDAKSALVDASNDAQQGIENLRRAEDAVADASKKTADIRKQLAEADAEAARKSRDLADETDRDIAAAQSDAADRRAEIAADGEARRAKIVQDNLDRIARIERDFSRSYQQAVGDRDAYAAKQAEQKRKDDLDDQALANQRALEEQEKAQQKALDSLSKALDKQLRTINANYDKQQAAIDDAFNKQYQNLTQSLNEAITAEQYANARVESIRSENAFRAEYYAGVVETANKRMADSAAAMAVSVNNSAALINAAASGANAIGGAFPPLSDANGNIIGGGAYTPNGGGGGGLFTAAYAMTPVRAPFSNASTGRRANMATPQDRPINVYVNGVGYTLGQVLNSNLALIDTLLDKGA